ncbi:MAG: G1 family glutamic endopeptidase, partial [Solirubrobacteraceae bacterium]
TESRYSFGNASHDKYRAGGLKKYTGKQHPKGLKGRIVGYAVAHIATAKHAGGGGTHTTPTSTTTTGTTTPTSTTPTSTTTTDTTTTGTTTTTSTPTVDCSSIAIETASLNGVTVTDAYSQTLTAGVVSGGSWSWTIQSGSLPSGLSLSSAGTIAGTPAASAAGTQSTFTAQATNSQCPGSPASKTFTLSVAVPPMSITTTSLPGGTYQQTYSPTQLQVTGGQPGDYQWSASGWDWSTTGLSLSTSGVLSGTPQRTGTYNVTFTVVDSIGATPSVSVTMPVTIAYPPLQITSPTSLSDGHQGVAYTGVQFVAAGGSGTGQSSQYQADNYTWAATELPTGMSMSVQGALSGTPTQYGTFTVAVTVADTSAPGDGVAPVTQDYTMTIAAPPLGFATTTLTANQGKSFTGHIVGQGGTAPYTISLVSGSLPSGLNFSTGTITGTTSVASGDYTFTVGVQDHSGATATETFNMWVAPSEVAPDLNVTSSTNGDIWAGYVEQASTAFTSVSGTLTVPSVNSSTTQAKHDSPWVGIDGNGTSNLIQAGVTAMNSTGNTVLYEAWWETLGDSGSPQDLPPQDEFEPTPGDTINVNIWQLSSGQWETTLNDVTSGQGFAVQVSYTGTNDTAEWIMETPSGSSATGYASTSVFSSMAASQAGTGMLELATTGCTPGTLSGSGFSITDYN